MKIQMGDVAAVCTETVGGEFILLKDWFLSADGEATYNHTFIIADDKGVTFEARPGGIRYYSLYDYIGKKVVIFRPKVHRSRREEALKIITEQLNGKRYPRRRILLHAASRPLARMIHLGIPVCSEGTAMYAYLMGIGDKHFFGRTPDMEVDRWRDSKHFYMVDELVLKPPESR